MSTADLPVPAPVPIGEWSPSLVDDLERCAARVAYKRDPAFAWLDRPSPRASLGLVAHDVTEAAWRAQPDDEGDPRSWLEQSWKTAAQARYAAMVAAWAPAVPPAPPDWPGHALTRARLLASLAPVVAARRSARGRSGGGAAVERWLTDPSIGLRGRPDRVESRADALRVIDLKSSAKQQEMSASQLRQLLLYARLVQVDRGRLPDEVAVLDAAGRESTVVVSAKSVDDAVSESRALVERFNAAVAEGSTGGLAQAEEIACRSCRYRVVCAPFWTCWDPTWRVGWGVLGMVETDEGPARHVRVRAEAPTFMAGVEVRVGGLSLDDTDVATRSIFGTHRVGGWEVQRTTWSTVVWPP